MKSVFKKIFFLFCGTQGLFFISAIIQTKMKCKPLFRVVLLNRKYFCESILYVLQNAVSGFQFWPPPNDTDKNNAAPPNGSCGILPKNVSTLKQLFKHAWETGRKRHFIFLFNWKKKKAKLSGKWEITKIHLLYWLSRNGKEPDSLKYLLCVGHLKNIVGKLFQKNFLVQISTPHTHTLCYVSQTHGSERLK